MRPPKATHRVTSVLWTLLSGPPRYRLHSLDRLDAATRKLAHFRVAVASLTFDSTEAPGKRSSICGLGGTRDWCTIRSDGWPSIVKRVAPETHHVAFCEQGKRKGGRREWVDLVQHTLRTEIDRKLVFFLDLSSTGVGFARTIILS